MPIIDFLTLPFFQRALIGGVLVSVLASLVGIFVVLKKSSFFGDTVAHGSLTGVALGLFLHINPLITAIGFALLLAFMLPALEKKSKLPVDNLLGFLLPFSIGIAVILLSLLPGYQPELMSYLFGSVLSISWADIAIICVIGGSVLSLLLLKKDTLLFLSFDEDYARLRGIRTDFYSLLLHIFIALTIVMSLKLVGIVLINALLIIPAMIARMYVKSVKDMFWITPMISVTCTVFGLLLSAALNVPSGPTIAVFTGSIFLVSMVLKKS
jgi:zinc transport system permease protein